MGILDHQPIDGSLRGMVNSRALSMLHSDKHPPMLTLCKSLDAMLPSALASVKLVLADSTCSSTHAANYNGGGGVFLKHVK